MLRRFLDKTSFCRIKVIKAFSKLTEENLVPRYMYMELFTAVIGRLRDTSVHVRKNALKLLQQLVFTFSIIFDVKVGMGEQFPAKETVCVEYESDEGQYIKTKEVFDSLEIESIFK